MLMPCQGPPGLKVHLFQVGRERTLCGNKCADFIVWAHVESTCGNCNRRARKLREHPQSLLDLSA